jgi:hypothetical protein
MHGPACICWADLTPLSLEASHALRTHALLHQWLAGLPAAARAAALADPVRTPPPGRLGALRVFLSESVLYGDFLWARGALTRQKWRFPAPRAATCLVQYLLSQKDTSTRFTILNGFRPRRAVLPPRAGRAGLRPGGRRCGRRAAGGGRRACHDVFSATAQPQHSLLKMGSCIWVQVSLGLGRVVLPSYDAFGVFGVALPEKIGVLHSK